MISFPMNAIKNKNLKGCCLGAICFYKVYKQGQRNHGHIYPWIYRQPRWNNVLASDSSDDSIIFIYLLC